MSTTVVSGISPTTIQKHSGSWTGTYDYRHTIDYGLSSEKHIYSLNDGSGSWNNLRQISVVTTSTPQVWADYHTTGYPNFVVETTTGGVTYIELSNTSGGSILFSFEKPTVTVPGSGQGGQGGNQPQQPVTLDPVIENVVFTKTDDDSVTLTFDWDENDGTLTQYNVLRERASDGTLNSTNTGVSGTSGSVSTDGSVHSVLDGLEHGDKVWIQNIDTPTHIVNGFGGITDPYIHKIVDWSIGYVSGTKSVIAKFFGSSPTPLPNTSPTFDGRLVHDKDDSVDWSHTGNLLTVSLPYKPGCVYQVKIRQIGSSTDVEDYGSSFRTPWNKVFHNFWQ